jgi:phosphonate transport system substrate-binding protein
LNGTTLAFPAPNAFGASLYLRALLIEKEKITFKPVYVGTHQNVYRHVLYGDVQAGGGLESTLEREPAAVQRKLKVLYRTPDSAAHPLAANPRVPKQVSDKIVQALRHMALNPDDQKLLRRVGLDDAIPADYARDYGPLEKLKLDRHILIEPQHSQDVRRAVPRKTWPRACPLPLQRHYGHGLPLAGAQGAARVSTSRGHR